MKYFFIVVFLFLWDSTYAQFRSDTLPPPIGKQSVREDIDWGRVGITGGVLAASITALHILQYKAWWQGNRGPFHIEDDPDYEKNFDKFGHFFGGYYSSFFFREAFTWSGMDSSQATIFGALCGAMYEFYVEIEDGLAVNWGFSPGDAKADIAGAAFFVLRNRIDFLRNFRYKWLYYPSGEKQSDDLVKYNPIDDYGGQTYWLTFDIHRMLPEQWKHYWPQWIDLAAGVGGWNLNSVDTLPGATSAYAFRQKAYYIGLDFDAEKIIPESDIGILNFIRRGLSYWHLPAPAYRLSPDPRFFILFPFKMSIGSNAH